MEGFCLGFTMTRIQEILKSVRYSLADPNKERYPDDRLLSAISEGQRDIARQTRLLKAEIDIVLDPVKPIYKLPSDLWLITRASFDNIKIPLLSYDRMDAGNPTWYTKFGPQTEALVYDKRNMHEIRVYPRPDCTYVEAEYSFVSDSPLIVDETGLTVEQKALISSLIVDLGLFNTQDPLPLAAIYSAVGGILAVVPGNANYVFGVSTSFDGVVPTSNFGEITTVDLVVENCRTWPGQVQFEPNFGLITNVKETTGLLHINYIKDPAPVVNLEDELIVTPIFDTALKYYTIGQAYSDDLDSQYQARAADAMAMYQRELQTVGYPTDETDGTRAAQYTPNYITPFGN